MIDYLLTERQNKNEKVYKNYKSFPTGTLIYVKDFSKQNYKKLKPVYLRAPEKVIREYASVVYSEDIWKRVQKRSKNNIKIAHPRSIDLFQTLPVEIQNLLGQPLNEKISNTIKDGDVLLERSRVRS